MTLRTLGVWGGGLFTVLPRLWAMLRARTGVVFGRAKGVALLTCAACMLVALCVLGLALSPTLPLLDGISFSPLVLDRHGQLLRMGLSADEKFRVRVTLPEIVPHAVQALLLYEDRHFYSHFGVNPLALGRAAWTMARGGRRMGGSTITMQVARLRYGLDTTTVGGKLHQILLALRLEWQYSKQEILEAYFCLAPYGGNVEGIAAAARVYFQQPPAHLTLSQSLALTPVPQNPVRRGPLAGRDFAAARARMHTMWEEAYTQQSTTAINTLPPLRIMAPAALPFEAPHVSAALLATVDKTKIPSPEIPPLPPSMVMHTTLSLPVQRLLEERLAAFAARGRVYGLNNAAAMLLHWPSMEIRALVGSARFSDPRIFGQVDGTTARRSPGSTLKPFIYALAMDQGLIHPQSLLVDSPRSFGGYDPENFDRTFRGPLPAHEALRTSRNIPAIWLASRLSPDLFAFLGRAGVQLPYNAEHYGLSLVLGGAELSMRELVELYAVLPNKGVWRPARLVQNGGASSAHGVRPNAAHSHLNSTDTAQARSLLSPEAAVLTLRMLEEPGHELRTSKVTMPHRYKTGTSNRFRDAWTVGVIGPYILAVWVGNFDNTPNPLLVGGEVAAPLYEDIATALALREPLVDEVPKLHDGLNILRIPVCTDTGDLEVNLCRNVTETWYIPGRSPTRPSNVYRTILVDSRTGLRACQPSEYNREEVREFWPTDVQALFARAGLAKPAPPPFGPECLAMEGTRGGARAWLDGKANSKGDGVGVGGREPRILSPRDNVVYQRRVGDELSGRNAIVLNAGVDADAESVFWFVNDRFIGRCAVGESLTWQPEGGIHAVRVVDNLGRASSRKVRVETVP